jgi:DNA invertase Pin-like site-specific DNA recombinase
MNPEQIALIALRVSTPEQLKNFSIETQRQRCVAYAEQHSYIVPSDGIAIDDETGATLYRDDFGMILRRLRAGEAKHLIVFVLDRLTREPADFLHASRPTSYHCAKSCTRWVSPSTSRVRIARFPRIRWTTCPMIFAW